MQVPRITITGGGLWGSLIAHRLSRLFPGRLEIDLFERHPTLGGNHTWSFHQSDLTPRAFEWILPFVSRSWQSGSTVTFPRHGTLHSKIPYHSIRSSQLHALLMAESQQNPLLKLHLNEDPGTPRPEKDSILDIDCTGWTPNLSQQMGGRLGYQKFVGWEVEMGARHGLTQPVLMDATVEQRDGFRFIYLLPWSETELLIEDTRYSDTPEISESEFDTQIHLYLKSHWKDVSHRIVRKEKGALPIPLDSASQHPSQANSVGLGGGFYHPTTGYSFLEAVHWIDQFVVWLETRLSALPAHSVGGMQEEFETFVSDCRRRRARDYRYFRLLNRMLFLSCSPQDRLGVFERFYSYHHDLVQRFYAGRLSALDQLKILFQKRPPVSIFAAIPALPERKPAPYEQKTAT